MRNLEKDYDFQRDYQYSKALVYILIGLFLTNTIIELLLVPNQSFNQFMITLIVAGTVFRFFVKALHELLYTFWGLSIFICCYLIYGFFLSLGYQQYPMGNNFYLSMILVLFTAMYLMSSPVYYPRVPWWEYDFRYRVDLKVMIQESSSNHSIESRLTDVRRKAGCLVAFDHLKLGDKVSIDFPLQGHDFKFNVQVTSSNEQIPGRGISYGVKFILKDDVQSKEFADFLHLWNKRNKVKIQEKFNLT